MKSGVPTDGSYFAPQRPSVRGREERHAVLGDLLVARHDRHPADLSLRDEQPVERVAMVRWQLRGGHGLRDLDRQRLKVARRQPFLDLARSVELAASSLQGDLPGRGCADEDEVRRRSDRVSSASAEPGIVSKPPEQNMRVEEKPQSTPNASARS